MIIRGIGKLIAVLFFGSLFCFSPSVISDYTGETEWNSSVRGFRYHTPVDSLTIEELWSIYANNPCYLPLIADASLWQHSKKIGFRYKDLFNDTLPYGHPYANRYLVGDFNVLDHYGNNRGIREDYPRLKSLKEFSDLPDDILVKMDTTRMGTAAYDSLIAEIKHRIPDRSKVVINFLEKVWNYRMLPIDREYSIYGDYMYAAGQTMVMCEACDDTLIMIGRFATSAKRFDQWIEVDKTTGKEIKHYNQYMPTGRFRSYYAGLNTITGRHWDYGRRYDSLDIVRDKELGGGGDSRVVIFEDKASLSNFLTISPVNEYSKSMHGNGIHEVSYIDGARGMLGTANSLGCLRVSDFASKFLRWWVPANCKLFIAYSDSCYHKELKYDGSIDDYLPFKTQEEGDAFRKWINIYQPFYAKILDVDEEGNYRNGYVIDAYYHLKDEYDLYLKSVGQ